MDNKWQSLFHGGCAESTNWVFMFLVRGGRNWLLNKRSEVNVMKEAGTGGREGALERSHLNIGLELFLNPSYLSVFLMV